MKSIVFFICLFFIATLCLGQKKETKLYMLDQNWKGTDRAKEAVYLLKQVKYSDTLYKWFTYHYAGPLIFVETFKDKEGQVPDGAFLFFNFGGSIDSSLNFKNGLLEGDSYFYNDTGRAIIKKTFSGGVLTKIVDLIKEDSVLSGNKAKKEPFVGVEVESEFNGGIRGWVRYLENNLKYPKRAADVNIEGTVKVQFVVDEDGKVSEAEIVKSVEYSIDEEAIRLIEKSPKWSPSLKDGKRVKSYKIQPITFIAVEVSPEPLYW